MGPCMQYICDAPNKMTWFRLEREFEAEQESALMSHKVAKHFRRDRENAVSTYRPTSTVSFEQNIGLESHVQREMPLFLTLRDAAGGAFVTAMLPPGGRNDREFKIIIVGERNSDPYPEYQTAIGALVAHFGFTLDHACCYPYRN